MECLIYGGKKPKLIQSARIQSFQEASKQRGDGLSEKLPKGESHFTCHMDCMSTQNITLRGKHKSKASSVSPSPKKLGGNAVSAFFKTVYSVARNAWYTFFASSHVNYALWSVLPSIFLQCYLRNSWLLNMSCITRVDCGM